MSTPCQFTGTFSCKKGKSFGDEMGKKKCAGNTNNCRPIHHWYLTDTQPMVHQYIAYIFFNYRSVDQPFNDLYLTDSETPHSAHISTHSWPTLDWHSTHLATHMLNDSWLSCWPTHWSTPPTRLCSKRKWRGPVLLWTCEIQDRVVQSWVEITQG